MMPKISNANKKEDQMLTFHESLKSAATLSATTRFPGRASIWIDDHLQKFYTEEESA
jgi:hypothetical protein